MRRGSGRGIGEEGILGGKEGVEQNAGDPELSLTKSGGQSPGDKAQLGLRHLGVIIFF